MIIETYLGMTTYFNTLDELKKYYYLDDNEDIKTLEDVEERLKYANDGLEYPHFRKVGE